MSNLNDFLGGGMLSHYRHEGFPANTSHGSYDNDSTVQIVGSTSDAHSFAREYKFDRVPGKKVFGNFNTNQYFYIKVDPGASMTGAPQPSGNWYDEGNALPVAQAVYETLRFKISTKNSAGGSYSVVETMDFSSGFSLAWGDTTAVKNSATSDVSIKIQGDANYSGSGSIWWQGSNTSKTNFIRITVQPGMKENIDECILKVNTDSELYVKLEWTVDNASWNSLFSGGDWTQTLLQGIYFGSPDGTIADYLYCGQRQYGTYSTLAQGNAL
jgi:hypothetical protein